MRSTKLRAAVAAAATLLALAPAVAAAAGRHSHLNAHRHASPARCRVSILVEPRVVTGGEQVQLFGQACTGAPANAVSQLVTIYERSPGSHGFKVLGTVPTGAGGFYTFIPPAITTDTAFYARTASGRSENREVRVAPSVTLEPPAGHPESAALLTGRRNSVVFSGKVSPADNGAEVWLERENATSFEEWRPIQRGVVVGGVFTFIHTFTIPGDANLRALVRPHGIFTVRGVSTPISYVISQAQNPKLTINVAPADPVAYETSITLSGTLLGGADKPLTLEGHPRGTPTFTPITTGMTNGEGKYAFAIAKALHNTYFRVVAGSVHSAVLFEGVKYVITSSTPPKTVQDGQALTLTGTVGPVLEGHPVYLERENTFGHGFHVADVGTVGAGGAYTVTHFVFGLGKQTYRVYIPGDPENMADSTAPFTIEGTPAPPGSLKAVLPPKEPH